MQSAGDAVPVQITVGAATDTFITGTIRDWSMSTGGMNQAEGGVQSNLATVTSTGTLSGVSSTAITDMFVSDLAGEFSTAYTMKLTYRHVAGRGGPPSLALLHRVLFVFYLSTCARWRGG